jgi:nucleoside-diphosphate-sugar epimerase
VARLRRQGHARIRSVDVKPVDDWYQRFDDVDSRQLDLRRVDHCDQAVDGASEVFNLAADMGGMGFIENNKALCMLSVLINTHLLMASREAGVEKFFFASSACVYAADKQRTTQLDDGLREETPIPRCPKTATAGRSCSASGCAAIPRRLRHAYAVARYHNIYGPHGTWDGGREKAPAAICRKVIQAKLSGTTRSRSGAMASRRAASPTSTTVSRDAAPHAQRRDRALNVGSDQWCRSTSWSTSSRRSPA